MFEVEYNGHKYQISVNEKMRQVTACSTFAGDPVHGIAKCHPNDTFNVDVGIEYAIRRCDVKIAIKKAKRGAKKIKEAKRLLDEAGNRLGKAIEYMSDVEKLKTKTLNDLKKFENENLAE